MKINGLYNLLKKFFQAAREGCLKQSLQIFAQLAKKHRRKLMIDFHFLTEQAKFRSHPHMDHLKKTTRGLHALMAQDKKYSFSILTLVEKGDLLSLRSALISALEQVSPFFEVLIGYAREEALPFLSQFQKKHSEKIQLFPVASWTELASHATGTHLFLLKEHDEIRPDLLYRYEQMLRLLDDPQVVLHGRPILAEESKREIHLPFEFEPFELYGLLVPRHMAASLSPLELDLQGARFFYVDVPLINSPRSMTRGMPQGEFSAYVKAKGLDWKIEPAFSPSCHSLLKNHAEYPGRHPF